jgi:hypothetical protein
MKGGSAMGKKSHFTQKQKLDILESAVIPAHHVSKFIF